MGLSKIEQETIITFNEEEQAASIFTYRVSIIRKLEKLSLERDDVKLISKGQKNATFEVPRNFIKVSPPRRVSEEQRQRMSDRMKEKNQGKKHNALF